MNKLGALLCACALGTALAGCSGSSPSLTAPERPYLNGSILGSGNVVAPPTTTVSDSTDNAAERNGSILGSGN